MGVVLAKAEMLDISIVKQIEETLEMNYNEAISAFKQVIPYLNKIVEQMEKVLKLLNTDESNTWDDGILVWCNIVRTKSPVQLVINDRYLPFN
eukprot:7176881-Ditylum_brightwellii.AAC.1